MGKLHTLRRAILRDPDKWKCDTGAVFLRAAGWTPVKYYKAYKKFIRKTLENYGDVGPADSRAR